MIVYRISRSVYSHDLTGVGAGQYGGRWNPVGVNLLYTSESISLCCLEYLVHNLHLLHTASIALTKIEVSEQATAKTILENELPDDWNEKAYTPTSSQVIGRDFVLEQKHYMLRVPSAIVPNEHNYLLNPSHSLHTHTHIVEQIDPFVIDERLLN